MYATKCMSEKIKKKFILHFTDRVTHRDVFPMTVLSARRLGQNELMKNIICKKKILLRRSIETGE